MVAIPGVLIGGIARGAGLQRAVVREGPTGDHQPLLGSGAFAFDPRLHPALDHLDGHRPFLAVSHRQTYPGRRIERLAPMRLPIARGLSAAVHALHTRATGPRRSRIVVVQGTPST